MFRKVLKASKGNKFEKIDLFEKKSHDRRAKCGPRCQEIITGFSNIRRAKRASRRGGGPRETPSSLIFNLKIQIVLKTFFFKITKKVHEVILTKLDELKPLENELDLTFQSVATPANFPQIQNFEESSEQDEMVSAREKEIEVLESLARKMFLQIDVHPYQAPRANSISLQMSSFKKSTIFQIFSTKFIWKICFVCSQVRFLLRSLGKKVKWLPRRGPHILLGFTRRN